MDKLTSGFQLALRDARLLALGRDHQFIEPAHLLAAVLRQDGSGVPPLLAFAGVHVNGLRAGLDRALDAMARVEGGGEQLHVSSELDRLLNLADRKARTRGDQYLSSETFVLASLEDRKNAPAELMLANGASLAAVERTV